jgi:hypothetical protein
MRKARVARNTHSSRDTPAIPIELSSVLFLAASSFSPCLERGPDQTSSRGRRTAAVATAGSGPVPDDGKTATDLPLIGRTYVTGARL